MEREKPTLRNIAHELFSRGYQQRAHERQQSSKTGWDLIFLPIAYATMGGYWYVFAKFFLWFHSIVYPAHVQTFQSLFNNSMPIATGLMIVVPLFSSMPLGFMTGNILMWLVPPARRASERKAAGIKWASFHESQLALFRMALLLVPIGLVSGIIGALIPSH